MFRRAPVLEYEVPKWDGDLGPTNLYVPLSTAQAAAQGRASSRPRSRPRRAGDWFSADTFMAVLRLRGIECRAADGMAEAFICRKLVVG